MAIIGDYMRNMAGYQVQQTSGYQMNGIRAEVRL
ncbi:hypothetical protein J2T61_000452 [Methanocalculus sp. AMF5]|nr:hypothetical protein [Methanocalculus sp. AMF5]